jgi:peptide/nickel transport system permease protein
MLVIYMLRRLGAGVIIFVTATTLCYLLLALRDPQSVVLSLLPIDASAEQVDLKIAELGLARPIPIRYVDWLAGLAQGDLGTSYVTGQPVINSLAIRVPVTLSVVVITLILTVTTSILLGVLAAMRGGITDRLLQGGSVVISAIPPYLLALILVIIFAVTLKWFPATGYVPLDQSPRGWLASLMLPSISLALGGVAWLAIWVRSAVIDIQHRDYVRMLRSRGLGMGAIMFRHVLRNAAAAIVQNIGLISVSLLGGSVIIERVFALPGIGTLALRSGLQGDAPMVVAVAAFAAAAIAVINFAVDVVNGLLNPKVRTR